MSLENLTEELRRKIGTGGGFGRSVKFDFSEQGVIRIDDRTSPTVIDNDDTAAECTIRISMDDFKDIAAGRTSPQAAFLFGRLKIEGDISVALQIGSFLND
jgi:putative sterol carrier protein